MESAEVVVERGIYKWWKQTISTEQLFTGAENADPQPASDTLVLKATGTRRDLAQYLRRLYTFSMGSGSQSIQGQGQALVLRDLQMLAYKFWSFSCTIGLCQGQRRLWTRGVSGSHCSAQLQNALFLMQLSLHIHFFSHLTLIEICFDYWEKGSKLKQMHGINWSFNMLGYIWVC